MNQPGPLPPSHLLRNVPCVQGKHARHIHWTAADIPLSTCVSSSTPTGLPVSSIVLSARILRLGDTSGGVPSCAAAEPRRSVQGTVGGGSV